MASPRTRFLLAGLVMLTVASLWRAGAAERERLRMSKAHAQAQHMVNELRQEHLRLSDELVAARQTIAQQTGDITGLRQEVDMAQARLNRAVAEVASLQRDVEQAREDNESLAGQLSVTMTQRQQLEAKLSSIKGLRLAIRELKNHLRRERWASWRHRLQAFRNVDEDRLASGNRGYVVREGTSTLGVSPRMQVHVLEPQVQ